MLRALMSVMLLFLMTGSVPAADYGSNQANSSFDTFKEKIDDAAITAEIKSRLMANSSTSAIRTKVQTRDGVVNISGTARNDAERELVTKVAQEVDGVKQVFNNMTVE